MIKQNKCAYHNFVFAIITFCFAYRQTLIYVYFNHFAGHREEES
jgi:hypothetical protein